MRTEFKVEGVEMHDTIFISHATPDDNEFVKWLGARLIGHGYKVWADLFELRGGTPFWNSIEEALRTRAVKVVFVVSRRSIDPARSGVRNELSVADAMRKSLGDPSFIIPIRIDDAPFDQLPIQVHQLNTLDFSRGWGAKLIDLLETLEHANVPKDLSAVDERMAEWRQTMQRKQTVVEVASEPLLTNLIEIRALPTEITFFEYDGDSGKIRSALEATDIPYALFLRFIIVFAAQSEIQERLPPDFTLKSGRHLLLQEFLDGPRRDQTAPATPEARRILTHLLRRHVEQHLLSRGLLRFETSGAPAFYFPTALVPDGKVFYLAASGKRTWKAVVGYSNKRSLHWHLAMKVNIDLGETPFIRFKPYLCFSKDGVNAIVDPKVTSKLRRTFCKSWWNKQWRQLQQSFVAFVTGEADEFGIALNGPQTLLIAGSLLQVVGTRRIPDDLDALFEPDEPEEPPEPEDDEADLGVDEDYDSDDAQEEQAA